MEITNGGNVLEEIEERELKPAIKIVISGGQVNINTDNGTINANQSNKSETVEKRIIIENKCNNNRIPNSGEKNNWVIMLGVLALFFAVGVYVKYRWQIRLGIIIVSLLIELLTCTIYYRGKKNRILYDKNLKQIGNFNMISVLIIPLLIGIISSPIYNSKIDFDCFKERMMTNNLIRIYFTNPSSKYILFQIMGLIFIVIFLIYIVWSDLYVISVINIALEKKGQKFWKQLLEWTCGKSKEGSKHIKIGLVCISVSVVMIMGIVPYILDSI